MNEALPSLHELFAQKIAAHPVLLNVARGNCQRWCEGHTAPDRLREWDALLAKAQGNAKGMARLQRMLAGTEADLLLRLMAGMRNRFIHDYGGVDCEMVWRTAIEDVPKLLAQVEAILATEP